MASTLSLDSAVTRSTEQVSADLSSEVVILGLRDSVYYGADGPGARIWQLLERPIAVQRIVDTLLGEFDVERSQCTDDVLAFVAALEAKGLVTRVAADAVA
jgi:hypothetical protein